MKIIPVVWLDRLRNALKYVRSTAVRASVLIITIQDLVAQGIALVPFFISTEDKPFDVYNFYAVGALFSFRASQRIKLCLGCLDCRWQ